MTDETTGTSPTADAGSVDVEAIEAALRRLDGALAHPPFGGRNLLAEDIGNQLIDAIPALIALVRQQAATIAQMTAERDGAPSDPLPPDHPVWHAADAELERIWKDDDAQKALDELEATLFPPRDDDRDDS